jgi:hypothetical protein
MKFIPQPEFRIPGEETVNLSPLVLAMMGSDLPANESFSTDICFSEDKEIFTFKYRVMYGYRFRAGFMENINSFSELDICCGADEKVYEEIKKKVHAIISLNIEIGKDPFEGIPKWSTVKPYPLDSNFCNKITSLYEQTTAQAL